MKCVKKYFEFPMFGHCLWLAIFFTATKAFVRHKKAWLHKPKPAECCPFYKHHACEDGGGCRNFQIMNYVVNVVIMIITTTAVLSM